jgi:hypothetical protein
MAGAFWVPRRSPLAFGFFTKTFGFFTKLFEPWKVAPQENGQ